MTYLYSSLAIGILAIIINIILIGRAEHLVTYLKEHHPKQVKKMGSLRFRVQPKRYANVPTNLTRFLWQRQWLQLNDIELDRLCCATRNLLMVSRIVWGVFAITLAGVIFFRP